MPYPVLVFLIIVGATVGVLIVGAALAVRYRAEAASAEEPDRRDLDDADLYDIE
jgi:heme/copper-type cytochrome/quinol oxidase subunit 2